MSLLNRSNGSFYPSTHTPSVLNKAAATATPQKQGIRRASTPHRRLTPVWNPAIAITMVKLTDLVPDVLSLIIEQVRNFNNGALCSHRTCADFSAQITYKPHLVACCLTCKRLRDIALPHLYFKLELTAGNEEDYKIIQLLSLKNPGISFVRELILWPGEKVSLQLPVVSTRSSARFSFMSIQKRLLR